MRPLHPTGDLSASRGILGPVPASFVAIRFALTPIDVKQSELDTFAIAAPGLEAVVAAELKALGIDATSEQGGASWRQGSLQELYRANLHLRTASRVLVRIARFRARSFIELERWARRIPWDMYISAGQSATLRVTSHKSRLYHERAIAERFTRWIGEDVGARAALARDDEEGGNPTDDAEFRDEQEGEQLFVIRFLRDECTVSADSSGALLHRRGYRQAIAKAPLRETLAAAAIRAAGWRGDTPLLDPLCGSGTIPIEAALIARKIPPGLSAPDRTPRRYAFESWRNFDPELWGMTVERARGGILPTSPVPISGSDRDAGAIEASTANAERAGVEKDIHFSILPLSRIEPPAGAHPTGLLIANPPYGVRVGEAKSLRNLYATLGQVARERFPGWRLAMVSASEELERQVGEELQERLATSNGGIRVRVMGT